MRMRRLATAFSVAVTLATIGWLVVALPIVTRRVPPDFYPVFLPIALVTIGLVVGSAWKLGDALAAVFGPVEPRAFATIGNGGAPPRLRWVAWSALRALYFGNLGMLLGTAVTRIVLLGDYSAYVRVQEWHSRAGDLFCLSFAVYTFASWWRVRQRWLAVALAGYPFFVVGCILGPTPVVPLFIFNLTVVPIVLLGRITRGMSSDARAAAVQRFAAYLFTAVAIATGIFGLHDPTLRHASRLRVVHGFFAIAAVILQIRVLRGRLLARRGVPPAQVRPWTAIATNLAGALVVSMALRIGHDAIIARSESGHRFASPRLASIEGIPLRTLPVETFRKSDECGSCHPDVYAQWSVSTHAFAARNLAFLRAAEAVRDRYGDERIRRCAGCHDPARALSEDPARLVSFGIESASEGVSCRVCHGMAEAGRGDGVYAVCLPRADSDSTFAPGESVQANFTALLEHRRSRHRAALEDGSACRPCHSESVASDHGQLVHRDEAGEFETFARSNDLRCHWCHMPKVRFDPYYYLWMDHRMFGSNDSLSATALPQPGVGSSLNAFDRDTEAWSRASLIPDASRWFAILHDTVLSFDVLQYLSAVKRNWIGHRVASSGAPRFAIALESIEWRGAGRDRTLRLAFRSRSHDLGHAYPATLFADLRRTWFHLIITDGSGRRIAGNDAADGFIHEIGRQELLPDGTAASLAQGTEFASIVDRGRIQPGTGFLDEYEVTVPDDTPGPLVVGYELWAQRYATPLPLGSSATAQYPEGFRSRPRRIGSFRASVEIGRRDWSTVGTTVE